MSRPILAVLRRTLYLFFIILVIVTFQVKLTDLPFSFTLRFVYIYSTACLLVSAGYELLRYLYRDEPGETKNWEEILKEQETEKHYDPLPFPREKD